MIGREIQPSAARCGDRARIDRHDGTYTAGKFIGLVDDQTARVALDRWGVQTVPVRDLTTCELPDDVVTVRAGDLRCEMWVAHPAAADGTFWAAFRRVNAVRLVDSRHVAVELNGAWSTWSNREVLYRRVDDPALHAVLEGLEPGWRSTAVGRDLVALVASRAGAPDWLDCHPPAAPGNVDGSPMGTGTPTGAFQAGGGHGRPHDDATGKQAAPDPGSPERERRLRADRSLVGAGDAAIGWFDRHFLLTGDGDGDVWVYCRDCFGGAPPVALLTTTRQDAYPHIEQTAELRQIWRLGLTHHQHHHT